MGSVQPTDSLTNRKPAAGEDRNGRFTPLDLEGVLEALQATTDRTIRRDRLERDDRAYRWCVRKAFAEGNPFRSSLAQAARGMGYETSGERDDDKERWSSTVHRALNSLQEAGLIRWGGVKRTNGAWQCIEVEMLQSSDSTHDNLWKEPPGRLRRRRRGHNRGGTVPRPRRRTPHRRPLGAQEGDRRCPHRPASPTSRIFFGSDEVATPVGGLPPYGGLNPLEGSSRARGDEEKTAASPPPANSQVASAAAPRPEWAEGSILAAELGQQQLGREVGAVAGAGPAPEWLPDARATLLRRFGELFGDPRFSHRRWGQRLDRALARLDRYANFGAGRRGAGLDFALTLIEGEAEAVRWERGRSAPASLAYFVPLLEEVSKDWRRAHARRSGEAPPGWRDSWARPKKRAGTRHARRAPATPCESKGG